MSDLTRWRVYLEDGSSKITWAASEEAARYKFRDSARWPRVVSIREAGSELDAAVGSLFGDRNTRRGGS